jgi:hypothetical protein
MRQKFVEHRPETGNAAAHIERVYLERLDAIVPRLVARPPLGNPDIHEPTPVFCPHGDRP